MEKCNWLSNEVIEDVSAFYVEEYLVWSDEGILGTMGEYARLCLGVFYGYAEDKYPHLASCESCSSELAHLVKNIDVKQWISTHPDLQDKYSDWLK